MIQEEEEDSSKVKMLKTIYEMVICEITESAIKRLCISKDFVSKHNEIGVIFNNSDEPTIFNIVCLETHQLFFNSDSTSNIINVVNSKEQDGILLLEDKVLHERYPGYF